MFLAAVGASSSSALPPGGEQWSRTGVLSRFATVHVRLADDGPMPGIAVITLVEGPAVGVGPSGSQPLLGAVALYCPWGFVDCEMRALHVERLTSDGDEYELEATWGDDTRIEVAWRAVGDRLSYVHLRCTTTTGTPAGSEESGSNTSQDVTLVGSDGEQYGSEAIVTGSWGGSPIEPVDCSLMGRDVLGTATLEWNRTQRIQPVAGAMHGHSLRVPSTSRQPGNIETLKAALTLPN